MGGFKKLIASYNDKKTANGNANNQKVFGVPLLEATEKNSSSPLYLPKVIIVCISRLEELKGKQI